MKYILFILIILSCLITTSCTHKNDSSFSEHQGSDMYQTEDPLDIVPEDIEDLNHDTCIIETTYQYDESWDEDGSWNNSPDSWDWHDPNEDWWD